MNDPHSRPPILDMTPEGEFREAPRPSWLDRVLARTGGIAILVLAATLGLVLVAVAILFISLLIPVAIGAGVIAAISIWWRRRRMRQAGIQPATIFVVRR